MTGSNSIRVMVVDDHAVVRSGLAAFLLASDDLELVEDAFARYSENVEVITAQDGSDALDYLQSLGEMDPVPCLVILDISMPVLNGREVLKKIRENSRLESLPVVFFTTSSSSHDLGFATSYNAGFVTKPLDVAQMEVITELFIDQCTEEIRKNIRRV